MDAIPPTSIRDSTLYDEFEIEGEWWLPFREEQRKWGVLKHTRDYMTLYLRGEYFPDISPQVILGETNNGYPFTLVGNQMNNAVYVTRLLFCGIHMPAPPAARFDSASVRLTQLPGWMRPKWPGIQTEFAEHRLSELTIHMEPTPYVSVYVPPLDATIALVGTYVAPSTYGVTTEIAARYEPFVKIIPNEPRDLTWFDRVTRDCQGLLNLLIGQTAIPMETSLILHHDEPTPHGIPHTVKVFYMSSILRDHDPDDPSPDYLFYFSDITDEIGGILNRWFADVENRREIRDLYFGSYYSPGTYAKYLFLGQIQALEGYLNEDRVGSIITRPEYRRLKSEIKALIKGRVPDEFKQSLMTSIGFANKYPLQQRMIRELDSWPDELRKYVARDPAFIEIVVKNRNYFTHYGDRPPFVLEYSDLLIAFERLRMFFMVLLFKEIGMTDERLMQAFDQHFRTKRIFQWHADWFM